MQNCEYAVLRWEGSGARALRCLVFSHCEAWEEIAGTQFMPTLCRLEEDGWQLVDIEHFTDDNLTFCFTRPFTQPVDQTEATRRPSI